MAAAFAAMSQTVVSGQLSVAFEATSKTATLNRRHRKGRIQNSQTPRLQVEGRSVALGKNNPGASRRMTLL
jgi:hypothetical protein